MLIRTHETRLRDHQLVNVRCLVCKSFRLGAGGGGGGGVVRDEHTHPAAEGKGLSARFALLLLYQNIPLREDVSSAVI